MKVSRALLRDYLAHVTVAWFARHDLPPPSLDDYGPAIESIRARAQADGRWDELRIALDYVGAHPEIQPREFLTLTFPFSNAQLRELIAHVREYLYPFDEPTPADVLAAAELD